MQRFGREDCPGRRGGEDRIALSVPSLLFNEEKGKQQITVESSSDWTLSPNGNEWCNPDKTKGTNGTSVTLQVEPNNSSSVRSVIYTFTCGSQSAMLTISQSGEGETPAIVLSKTEYTVPGEGATIEIELNTNVDFKATIPSAVTWIHKKEVRSMTPYTLHYMVDPNDTRQERSAKIIFTDKTNKITQSVEVKQLPNTKTVIEFADAEVLRRCIAAGWDTDGDGCISHIEAIAVTDIPGEIFGEGPNFTGIRIGSFDELRYFTSLKTIGNSAFFGCTSLTSISIPEGVTTIGEYTFDGCSSLTSILIPEGVTTIGRQAFCDCSNLTTITIPEGVTTIETATFYRCRSLTSITIPEGLTTIGGGAFESCSSLTSIVMPESLTTIAYRAFYECYALKSITIPESVTTIEGWAFEGCSLISVTFNGESKLTSIGKNAFYYCDDLTAISIPQGVTKIESDTFYRCSSLTSVTFNGESKLTSIGADAFYYCSNLKSITIPEGVTTIGDSAFYRCYSLTVYCRPTVPPVLTGNGIHHFDNVKYIYVPSTQYQIYRSAYGWERYASIIRDYNF